MSNYFQGTANKPYHISVGAILLNQEGKVACHHFKYHPRLNGEAYILMRETLEEGESLEKALKRGLKEEFVATGELITYVGSLVKPYQISDVTVQKTTLYFAVKLITINENERMSDDPEAGSTIEWLTADDLIRKTKHCASELNLPDTDESEILKRAASLGII